LPAFRTRDEAAQAVMELDGERIDLTKISIVGQDGQSEEREPPVRRGGNAESHDESRPPAWAR
jgi:hypothetical protein